MSDDHTHDASGDSPDDEEIEALTPEQKEAALRSSIGPLEIPEEEIDKFRDFFTQFIKENHPEANVPGFDPGEVDMTKLDQARRASLKKVGYGHDEFHMIEAISRWVGQMADSGATFTRVASLPASMIAYLKSDAVDLETLEALNKTHTNCIGTNTNATIVFTLIQAMFALEGSRRHMMLAHSNLGEEALNAAMHALQMAGQHAGMMMAYSMRRMFDEKPCECEDRFSELFDEPVTPVGAEVGMELDAELEKLLSGEGEI
jgi:hypothetical protein